MMHITEPLPTDKRSRLVFGIDWRAYPVKGGKSERRRYADAFGATHYVEFKVGTEQIGGFAMPDLSEMKGAHLYSGAARIALHDRIKSRTAALVLLQDGLRVYTVLVVRGAVRSDEVLTPEAAQSRRLEIEQECLKGNLSLVTLGTGDRIGDVDEPFQASELLVNRKVGRLAKLPVSVPTIIPVAAIIVGAVVGVPKLMDLLSPPAPPPRAPTFAEQYATAVQETFAKPQPRASALAPALLAAVGASETVIKGWLFQEANCPSSGYCTIAFRRNGGTFSDFEQAATAGMRPVAFARDGLTLTSRGAAVPTVASLVQSESSKWPTAQAFVEQLQTPPQRMSAQPYELRAYGYTVSLGEARPLIAASGAGARVGRLIKQGEWKIEGFRWQSALLAKLPPNMALESLKVELRLKEGVGPTTSSDTGDSPYGVHFTAQGKYYVFD
ncbi:type 4b pilus protein PilO2 [Burkholderia sp. Ac-20345]|uniref:type 4b pilus protein PilO2 n=1 Tax=Burkholderia sp. Ac-20345 TaxID=2703891 RepID=UPI00197B4439|nr:type 4b pilus protein PilO2 [Burkholderia sp. Ac-20345]MBN3776559.1 type 4b pilus protein PilO2 [Burkholderia sp. Ac-20345]